MCPRLVLTGSQFSSVLFPQITLRAGWIMSDTTNSSDETNKDHQRMMVDPMYMIVQNLRLFLTTVTPTAVAPTVVILWNSFR